MTAVSLAGSVVASVASTVWVLGLFGRSKPGPSTILDKEEVAARLRLGLDDLSNADTRTLGMERMSDISLEDARLAYQILCVVDEKEREEPKKRGWLW